MTKSIEGHRRTATLGTRLCRANLAAAAESLAARDPHLASIYQVHGVPPMWGRPQGFVTLLRIVLEQQVSLVSARSIFRSEERRVGKECRSRWLPHQ